MKIIYIIVICVVTLLSCNQVETGEQILIPFEKNRKVGYYNQYGRKVIEYKFLSGDYFYNDLAVVETEKDIFGYIDRTGKIVIQAKFDRAYNFTPDGLALVAQYDSNKEKKYGYINKKGELVIPYTFDVALPFSNGFAPVAVIYNGELRMTFINTSGKMISQPKYLSVYGFYEGYGLVVDQNGKCGYITKNGEYVIPPKYDYLGEFSEGLCGYSYKNEKLTGYIDINGKIIIPAKYIIADSFKNGLALVAIVDNGSKKIGFINKEGNFVIPPKYDNANPFLFDFTGVTLDLNGTKRIAVIDKNGSYKIPPILVHYEELENGLFVIYEDGMAAVIDRNGKIFKIRRVGIK